MYLILDIARGIASLSVFLYHIKESLESSSPALAKIAQFGNLGVPLFFVISGYVITASVDATLRKNGNSNAFLKRRFLRIYPPFWISILVVLPIPYIIAAISSLKSGVYYSIRTQIQRFHIRLITPKSGSVQHVSAGGQALPDNQAKPDLQNALLLGFMCY